MRKWSTFFFTFFSKRKLTTMTTVQPHYKLCEHCIYSHPTTKSVSSIVTSFPLYWTTMEWKCRAFGNIISLTLPKKKTKKTSSSTLCIVYDSCSHARQHPGKCGKEGHFFVFKPGSTNVSTT